MNFKQVWSSLFLAKKGSVLEKENNCGNFLSAHAPK